MFWMWKSNFTNPLEPICIKLLYNNRYVFSAFQAKQKSHHTGIATIMNCTTLWMQKLQFILVPGTEGKIYGHSLILLLKAPYGGSLIYWRFHIYDSATFTTSVPYVLGSKLYHFIWQSENPKKPHQAKYRNKLGLSLSRSRYSRVIRSSIRFLIALKSGCKRNFIEHYLDETKDRN